MLNRLRIRVLVLAALAPGAMFAQSSGCHASVSDSLALELLYFSGYVAAATDSASKFGRANMGLPPLDSTKVVLTQHTQTCTRIVHAINAYHDRPNAVLRVRVVRLARSGYMAYDGSVPDLVTSSRRPVNYLERDFVVKTVLLGL